MNMSSEPADKEAPAGQNGKNQAITVLSALGCILIFLLILFVAYLPTQPEDPLARTAEERLQILRDSQSRYAGKYETLEIVNPEQGVYKIPLDDAMEVTVQAYQRKQQDG